MRLPGRRSRNVEVAGQDNVQATSEEAFIQGFRRARTRENLRAGAGTALGQATARGIQRVLKGKKGR